MVRLGWGVLVMLSALAGCGDDDANGGAGGAGGSGGSGGGAVPTNASALFDFLKAGSYHSWAAESAPHVSSGPHGMVRTYVNDVLEQSLAASNAAHPQGAASVKELYSTDGTTLSGWAVWVKLEADSAAGQNIYWYEVFSTTDGSSPAADGNGVPLCASCHGGSASDFFLSPYPLQ